ncbi:MAG: hypothetical protein OEV64_06000 [Desulfobulbaceae bacterium]|nr:hypothetical protein [Desulfobulbaceae bacterium]
MAAKRRVLGNRRGTMRLKIWAAMRIMKRFTYADLEATTEANNETLRSYVNMLTRYGYIRCEGTYHRPIFILSKDTGPQAPMQHSRRGLRDMNTGEIFTPEDIK